MSGGLWISPNTYRELSETPLSREIATRAKCEHTLLMDHLPDPDEVLRKMGRDITVYKGMLTDPQVGACLDSRKSGTKKRLWEIDRGKSKSRQAKVIEKFFEKLDIRGIINEILDSVFFGFQPIEIMWEKVGELVLPTKLVGKPAHWFGFDEDSNLLLKTKTNPSGEPLPPRKFVVAQNNPKYENPYGDRVASRCFWYHRFKKNGVKWWVVFAEKYGMPWIVGKTPRGSQEKEINELLDMLNNMVRDAIGVVPDDSSVDVMSIKQSGSISVYDRLTAYCDAQISKAILGHSAGADSTPGKLGGDDLALEAREDLVDNDSNLVESVLNQVIDWTVEINWGPNVDRPKFILYEEDDVDQGQATRDKTLADTGQIQFTEQYFHRTYGFEKGDFIVLNSRSPEPNPHVELAERTAHSTDQDDVDELLDSLSPAELQSQIEPVLKPVIELIESAAGYEEVMEKLVDLYPKLDDTKLQNRLGWAMSLARLRGRTSTQPAAD